MPSYTVLVCPSCGGKTSIAQDLKLATCDYCGNQLILRPWEGIAPRYPTEPSERPKAPMPKGVRVDSLADGIEITRRWFSAKYIFLAFFCAFWDGFLLIWYGIAFSTHGSLMMICFPLLHLAVGIGITYSTLAGFINSSTVRVTRSEMTIEHYPLPWPGGKRLMPTDLDQLYTKEVTRSTKNGSTTSYTLCGVFKDGRKIDLLKDLDSPEMGFFIEQQVESWLMIADRPVAGEMTR